jgi:hypothetical protein
MSESSAAGLRPLARGEPLPARVLVEGRDKGCRDQTAEMDRCRGQRAAARLYDRAFEVDPVTTASTSSCWPRRCSRPKSSTATAATDPLREPASPGHVSPGPAPSTARGHHTARDPCAEIRHAEPQTGKTLQCAPATKRNQSRVLARCLVRSRAMPKVILVTSREPLPPQTRGCRDLAQARARRSRSARWSRCWQAPGHFITWSGLEARRERVAARAHPACRGWRALVAAAGAVSEREASLFYYGFRLPHLVAPHAPPRSAGVSFDAEAWRAFRRVNQRFAEAVLEVWQPATASGSSTMPWRWSRACCARRSPRAQSR